jgi:hypothetical protein
MESLEHVAAIAIALVALVMFALMTWAGQHQS